MNVMGVYIKGMKMPKLEKNKTMQMTLWNDDGIMRVGIQTGGYWCSQEWTHYPVMEISTPHGRLVDADLLDIYGDIFESIKECTIIEAEGE